MKKLYNNKKHKLHSYRVSQKVLKYRKTFKYLHRKSLIYKSQIGKGKTHRISFNKQQFQEHEKKKKIHIQAPSNFSIIDNIDEMLLLFNKIEKLTMQTEKIFLDLSIVERITPESILYILSEFDYLKTTLNYLDISGNVPVNEECKSLFIQSGYFDYVNSANYTKNSNNNILSIKSNNLVIGEIAQEVVEFSLNHIKPKSSPNNIYKTIIECMANTNNHAYSNNNIPYSKWWLMATYNEKENKVHFSFVDNGKSIPKTIKKKISDLSKDDGNILLSACDGKFQSSSKLKWRGTGLPKIKVYADNSFIENLIIVSNKGYANISKKKSIVLNNKFNGTLLSWDFI